MIKSAVLPAAIFAQNRKLLCLKSGIAFAQQSRTFCSAGMEEDKPKEGIPKDEDPPKSGTDQMHQAYGEKYASHCSDEAYGQRYRDTDANPFHEDFRGDKAVEAGVPELKNRGKDAKAEHAVDNPASVGEAG